MSDPQEIASQQVRKLFFWIPDKGEGRPGVSFPIRAKLTCRLSNG